MLFNQIKVDIGLPQDNNYTAKKWENTHFTCCSVFDFIAIKKSTKKRIKFMCGKVCNPIKKVYLNPVLHMCVIQWIAVK